MTSKRNRWLYLITLLLLLCTGLVTLEQRTHFLRAMVDLTLYDNRQHYLSCNQLPAIEEVQRVMADHRDVLEQIEAAHPNVTIMVDDSCPGKGSIRIDFPGRTQREQIEAIIGSDTFFGIPYALINT